MFSKVDYCPLGSQLSDYSSFFLESVSSFHILTLDDSPQKVDFGLLAPMNKLKAQKTIRNIENKFAT